MMYLNDISFRGGEIFDGGKKKILLESGCVRIKHMHTPISCLLDDWMSEKREQLSLLLRGLEEKWYPWGFNLRGRRLRGTS